MEQGGGEGCLLLHTMAVGVNWIVGNIAQLKELEQLFAAVFDLLVVDLI